MGLIQQDLSLCDHKHLLIGDVPGAKPLLAVPADSDVLLQHPAGQGSSVAVNVSAVRGLRPDDDGVIDLQGVKLHLVKIQVSQ